MSSSPVVKPLAQKRQRPHHLENWFERPPKRPTYVYRSPRPNLASTNRRKKTQTKAKRRSATSLRYPDRYRPNYGGNSFTFRHQSRLTDPSEEFLASKLADVLAAEGTPGCLTNSIDNPHHLPPHLHAVLCMQQDYINAKIDSNDAFFRMLETSHGRLEMKRQARRMIKASLEERLVIAQAQYHYHFDHGTASNSSWPFKTESPQSVHFSIQQGTRMQAMPVWSPSARYQIRDIDFSDLNAGVQGFQVFRY